MSTTRFRREMLGYPSKKPKQKKSKAGLIIGGAIGTWLVGVIMYLAFWAVVIFAVFKAAMWVIGGGLE